MSIAGIRSNRGDGYQTLVAFDWALTVLSNPEYLWLEIDSISYSVDDVVVGKANGTIIGCQCKKNQIDFSEWKIADLTDELDKAIYLLANNQHAEVRFYSRNNFGALAKLKEYCSTQQDEDSYLNNLSQEHQKTNTTLSAKLVSQAPNLSTYDFLRRTTFTTSEELDRMSDLLHERLRNMVNNTQAAYNALWTRLDELGARMIGNSTSAVQYRLTKSELKSILQNAGVILVPPMNLAEVRLSFSHTSAIGRTWRRDIAGQRIFTPVLNELLSAIAAKQRAILLIGLPGSGKTCVMLALQEELELLAQTKSDIVPLFVQSREFADLATSEDRQAQGLSAQWVDKAARLAEDTHVVVVIDSLDVLSTARDHVVLQYFLAQIDRLLLITNVTVVTACRDFDRHYDRRIAERQWDCELKCQPLSWDTEISPLLDSLGIATTSMDTITRELIRNPRELSLFVELAQRDGSFNVVTGHALAQRYLDTIVRMDDSLGDNAMQAIERMASEMMKSRSLMIPYQRFVASQEIKRTLCSLNILQQTNDGSLTFGHQTLLDVLVISGAIRAGLSLNEFIQSLPPVPFVRPSIRCFVNQLALGERREFRKQLRAVLSGNVAFHVRRLVAESFSEQIPQDEDWPLIRDLRENHRDVFQVIYFLGRSIEWHYFWLKYLVPILKITRDVEGLTGHIYRVAQWLNEDTANILSLWNDSLSITWLDSNTISDRLGLHLSDVKSENLRLVTPFLLRLLDLPRTKYSSLGRIIARAVDVGVADDALLWRYITSGIVDEDLVAFSFDDKLLCHSHEFGDKADNFLSTRMKQSTDLLNLAVETIERWSNVRKSRHGNTRVGFREGFLRETSYDRVHSQRSITHVESMDLLLDAVEASIINHAQTHSDWWKINRERLCFNHEGSLLYFAILACTKSPEANIDLIGRMLCDQNMLEFGLEYELGSLIQSTFKFFSPSTQDSVMACILTIWSENSVDESNRFWVLKNQSELISSIPCCLRTPEVQAVIDAYEKIAGTIIRQPSIHSTGGMVVGPFSFEVFLGIKEIGVLNLLNHYNGYSNRFSGDLIGGEREVGSQLREASSRHPTRFLDFLSNNWASISERFRDDIMEGVATYLSHRYGNLKTHGIWQPVEEPDALSLSKRILDELENHPLHWQARRSASKAIVACANVIYDTETANRLVFLSIGFERFYEKDPISGDNVDLISLGINMVKGDIAEALMILATNLLERERKLPELMVPTLRRFAGDEHPAIRALILRRLPYLQSKSFELSWDLFNLIMSKAQGLWQQAESYLYYSYHKHFEVVSPILSRLRNEGKSKELETWARIMALSAMSNYVDIIEFLDNLKTLNQPDAWKGAASVWSNAENIKLHEEQCLLGIEAGLNAGDANALAVAKKMVHIFRDKSAMIFVPINLISSCLAILENDRQDTRQDLYGINEWLNAFSQLDTEYAISVTEIYLAYVSRRKPHLYDHEDSFTQLMTRLFAEAEEREETDHGAMLQRVVVIQDTLLSLGVNGVTEWLKAAERP